MALISATAAGALAGERKKRAVLEAFQSVAFTSAPYVQALQSAGRSPVYWRVPFAQHFDALLALPGFGERHVPLLPYGYAALDEMWTQLTGGAQAAPHRFASQPRGSAALESAHLGLAGRR